MSVTLIAGSRSLESKHGVRDSLSKAAVILPSISEVIHGGARGVDGMGGEWAEDQGIPVTVYLANWELYGKSAGFLRNVVMADACDQAIIIWDGQSRGTKHTIDLMLDRGKPMVLVVGP